MNDEMIDGVSLPGRFRTVLDALRTDGFAVSSKQASDRDFGNIQVILTDGTLDVELLRERGSPFIYLGLAGQRRLPVGVWRAFLEGSHVAQLDTAFEDEARFAETSLDTLRDRLDDSTSEAVTALLGSAKAEPVATREELWD